MGVGLWFVSCSCSSIVGYRGNSHGPKVAVIGDSITVQMQASLRAFFEPEFRLLVKAKSGQRIDQQLPALRSVLHTIAGPPDRIVIDLGTNDALQSHAGAIGHLATAMALVVHVKCVVWVTINRNADTNHATVAGQINQALLASTASHPNFRILDWNALLQQGDDARHWLSPADDIHLSAEGTDVLALHYLAAIRSCPA